MKGYHYTSGSDWARIKAFDSGQGLVPQKNLVPSFFATPVPHHDIPEWAYAPHLFAFLEHEPREWIDSNEFPKVWTLLMHAIDRTGMIEVYAFDVLDTDEAFVIDWAIMERHRRDLRAISHHNADPGQITAANKALFHYAQSHVPVKEYDGNYTLPELIIKNEIPRERLTCVQSILD